MLRGQSSHSSWFFVESARIGDINANVTIALTSSILAARHGGVAPEIASGLFRRFIGTSGFQLINVNNVPLLLRGWSMDTRLIGRKALTNSLLRHYLAQAISEAHKVTSIPLEPPPCLSHPCTCHYLPCKNLSALILQRVIS